MTKHLKPIMLLAALLFAAGCGSSGVVVEGQVNRGGQPVKLVEGEGISVTITSDDGASNGSGQVDSQGKFTIKSSSGTSLPPGKYKVAYVYYPPGKGGKSAVPQTKTTNEVWDISSSNHNFTLDLGK